MRILILSQWFDPEPTFKGLAFARELIAQGHEVEVITGFPNYPGGTIYPGYRIRWRKVEVIDGIRVVRVPLYPSHDSSGLRRVANYASFAMSAAIIGALSVRKPDVIYVYHPPATVGFPAFVLGQLYGVPFVYDVQDLWPDTLAATGMLGSRGIQRLVGSLCQGIYRSASHLVVLSPGFKERLTERGVDPEKITVIPNWCDEGQLGFSRSGPDSADRLGLAGRFNVVFAGTMGKAQALDSVLDAAKRLQEREDIQFVFVGGGIEVERLKARAERMRNVRFLPRRPMSEIGEILHLADVLLVHLKKDPLFEITIPSKTQAYMAAGRPLLMAVEGDAAQLVEASGAGVTVPSEDPGALSEAVLALANMPREQREAMGDAGRQYYLRELSLKAGTARFVEVLKKVAQIEGAHPPSGAAA